MDYNIIAQRFVQAKDSSSVIEGRVANEIEYAIMQEFMRLQPFLAHDTEVCDEDPYPCFSYMLSSVNEQQCLKVRQYLPEESFGIGCDFYTRFRAVHDWHHCLLNLGFDWNGEALLCSVIAATLQTHSEDTTVSRWVRSVLLYQVASFMHFGAWLPEVANKVVLEDLTYGL